MPSQDTEYKTISFTMESKDASEDGKYGYVSGYGAYFGNTDRMDDVIEKGAFAKISNKVKMFYNHRKIVGLWDSLKEDDKGLMIEGRLFLEDEDASKAYIFAKEGALDLSVGFRTKKYYIDKNGVRVIQEAELFEVSLVDIPCNPKANVLSVKSMDDLDSAISEIETKRDFERFLKDCGFSQKQSKALISKGFSALQRDVDNKDEASNRDDEAPKVSDSLKAIDVINIFESCLNEQRNRS